MTYSLKSTSCIDKFSYKICREITLPENELKLSEAISCESYWSKRSLFSVLNAVKKSNIIEYDNICFCKNLSTVLNYNSILDMVSKSMWNQEFSFVDNILKQTELSFNDRNPWRELERHVKSKDLSSVDFKIGIFNKILAMIIQNVKSGIMNWSLMDPKYFGNYSKVIKACLAQVDKLNDFLADAEDMLKIEYFGVPPANYEKDLNVYKKVNEYYRDYLRRVTRSLNPNLDEYLVRELVDETVVFITKKYGLSSKHQLGINSKLVLYTLIKLVEKSIKFRKIKCIYLLDPVKNGIKDLLNRVEIKNVLKDTNTNGLFSIKTKLFKSDEKYAGITGYQMQTKRAVKKRDKKLKSKRKESIDFILDEPIRKSLKNIPSSNDTKMHKRFKNEEDFKLEESLKTVKFTCKDTDYEMINVDDVSSISSTNSNGYSNDLDSVLQDIRYI